MAHPDVSVVVPVYNTMPYLTRCLDSLVAQTIGLDRIQVLAVDDGSTDGSAEELDRYAQAHPDSFTVIHQANSGGPAGPCNVGLELATGRYVFFLGADDYLGDEALERLVSKADEWDSDVIFGRMRGVGGRFVHDKIFTRTEPDLTFETSELPFAVSNTKLFRRDLIERHGLRYSRDLRIGSDQPFTIDAMVHARRISVLADYTYYYAVRRADATNISFSSRWRTRLDDIGVVMKHVADLVPAGPTRDAILRRHFGWELTKLLRTDLPVLDDSAATELANGIAVLADTYLTDWIRAQLYAEASLYLRLAQARELDLLRTVTTTQQARGPGWLLVIDGGHAFAALPGFRDKLALPDEWFRVRRPEIADRVAWKLSTRSAELDGTRLTIAGRAGLAPESADSVRISLVRVLEGATVSRRRRSYRRRRGPEAVDFPVRLIRNPDGGPAAFEAELDLRVVLDSDATESTRWAVRLRVDVAGRMYDVPLPARHRRVTEISKGLRRFQLIVGKSRHRLMFVRRERLPSQVTLPRMLRRTKVGPQQ